MHTTHVHVPDRSFAGMKTILDIAQENECETRQCRNSVLMNDDTSLPEVKIKIHVLESP